MRPIWVAILHDGGVLVESPDRTWDDVPPDVQIRFLQLRNEQGGDTIASLSGFVSCYAYNESTAMAGRQGTPSAKVIGAVMPDGTVREVRLEFQVCHVGLMAPTVNGHAMRKGLPG